MRRFLAGGIACGVAAAVVMGGAAPSGAGQLAPSPFVLLDAEILPDADATPGEGLTAVPLENCTLEGEGPGVLRWAWFLDADVEEPLEGVHFAMGEVPLAEDGSWEVPITASNLDGDYVFLGFCLPNGVEGDQDEIEFCDSDEVEDVVAATVETGDTTPDTVPEEPPYDCLFEDYEEAFTVTGGTTPSTVPPGTGTPPPIAPPATPVVEEPPFTG